MTVEQFKKEKSAKSLILFLIKIYTVEQRKKSKTVPPMINYLHLVNISQFFC